MSVLLGPNGQPISSSAFARPAKPAKPVMGPIGAWAGKDRFVATLPGGTAMQFDTSRLTLADLRLMKEHYQINSSLSLLSFMLHQLDYDIICDDKEVKEFLLEQMNAMWTRLVRALSQAFWAGFSPNILEWENDVEGKRVVIGKVKDLYPEEAVVNWKYVEGAATTPGGVRPKVAKYDGIRQAGVGVIPQPNTLWYPLLMDNGNYYGRRLLKAAFQPWYFSQLMHLFSNRYYERFGEPVPVGRAPSDEKVTHNGAEMDAKDFMAGMLNMVRNRAAIVLPSDKTPNASGTGQDQFDYTIEYLESQMRGGDFGQYISRLDEEISLSLFTPLLMMRTADGGGYNQGVGHQQVYLWMLNAVSGDMKEYLDRYILAPLVTHNFPGKRIRAEIKFRKLGTAQTETIRAIVTELVRSGTVKPSITELGQAVGMSLEEIEVITEDPERLKLDDEGEGEDKPRVDKRIGRDDKPRSEGPRDVSKPRATTKGITARVQDQAVKAFKDGSFDKGFIPLLGYRRSMSEAFESAGAPYPVASAYAFLDRATRWIGEVAELGSDSFNNSAVDFMKIVSAGLEGLLEEELGAL